MGMVSLFCMVLATSFIGVSSLGKTNCSRPVNILFLLESSRNINNQLFLRSKQLIKEIADAYEIIPGQTDVAVVLFGYDASVAVNFGQNGTSNFKQEVDKLKPSDDEPFIHKAFSLVSDEEMFDRAIPYAARAVVVMTTGENGGTFDSAVEKLKKSNSSHIFAIQLAENPQNLRQLLEIATEHHLIYDLNELFEDRRRQNNFLFQICNSLGDIRLKGSSLSRGRLEVFKNRTWLPVCRSPTWNSTLTDSICSRLGFSVNGTVGNNNERVLSLLNDKKCDDADNSSSVSGCGETGSSVNGNCNHSQYVNLGCQVPVRLSGSPSRTYIGLVEVFLLGTWGSICIDILNLHAANIICQNLGYPKALKTFVDVSNDIKNLPVMLLKKVYCTEEKGSLEQNCSLKRCDGECNTFCKRQPASVICDSDPLGRTPVQTITEKIETKLTKSCKLSDDIRWYYENGHERRNLSSYGHRIKFITEGRKSTLSIRKVLVTDGGAYFCQSDTQREMLFLYVRAEVKVQHDQFFYPGKDGRLRCNVQGSPPPTITWERNNKSIGSDKESLSKYAIEETGSLLIRNISAEDRGVYQCKFSQKTGETITSDSRKGINLHLYEYPYAKILDPIPTVAEGIPVIIRCNVTGCPNPTITWYKNGTVLPKVDQYLIDTSPKEGFILSRLTIKLSSSRDSGMYTCTARNAAGSKSAFTWITVQVAGSKEPDSSNSNSNNKKQFSKQSSLLLIVGIFVSVAVVALLGVVVWFVRSKRKASYSRKFSSCHELYIVSSKSCDIWELPKGSLHFQKKIGTGMFGEVFKAVALNKNSNESEQIVAVKKPKDRSSEVQNDMLKQEIEVNKRLAGRRHTNIVNFLGCITSEDMIMMVMEYVPYGDLLGYLRESRGIKDQFYCHCEELPHQEEVSPYELFSFATQIACGMAFLADKKVIHRDLAARNVLVGENLTCKITDFGLAKVLKDENDYMGSRKGRLPIKWTAPEVFVGNANITSQSDVWSYGITLYEIFTIGGDPYPGLGEWDIVYKIKTDKYIMPKPEHVSDKIYDIMVSCWKKDPKLRPTFDELYNQLTKMVETNHYLDLDMAKYQGNKYANLEDMDDNDMLN